MLEGLCCFWSKTEAVHKYPLEMPTYRNLFWNKLDFIFEHYDKIIYTWKFDKNIIFGLPVESTKVTKHESDNSLCRIIVHTKCSAWWCKQADNTNKSYINMY